MPTLKELFGFAALGMEAVGVATIVLGSVYIVARLLWRRDDRDRYGGFRRNLGRAIVLGLEFLIAGDIIRTVAVAHTLESVAVLGIIVLIRTFLSITLEFGIEGPSRWRRPARAKG
jgi:uncharacterized membrane protein